MIEINTKISNKDWSDVVNFMKSCKHKEVKPKSYYELLKLCNILQSTKSIKDKWHNGCDIEGLDDVYYDESSLTDSLQRDADDICIIIDSLLENFIKDIKSWIEKYYTLSLTHKELNNNSTSLAIMADIEDINQQLNRLLNKNIFQDMDIADNFIHIYDFLLDLQKILLRLKTISNNKKIESILRLTQYTKTQLRQITNNLGCDLYLDDDKKIKITKHNPGLKNRPYCDLPTKEYWAQKHK